MIVFILQIVFTRAQGSRATCRLNDFNKTLAVERVHPKIKKDKVVSVLFFSGGGRYRIYDALTAMVVNQLL